MLLSIMADSQYSLINSIWCNWPHPLPWNTFFTGLPDISSPWFSSYLIAPTYSVSFPVSSSFPWPLNVEVPRSQTPVFCSFFPTSLDGLIQICGFKYQDPHLYLYPSQSFSLNSRLIYSTFCSISPSSRFPNQIIDVLSQIWCTCNLSHHNWWQLYSFGCSAKKLIHPWSSLSLTCTSDLAGIYFQNISRIQPLLTSFIAAILVKDTIVSHLDYCHSLLSSLSAPTLAFNTAARVVI